MSSSDDFSRDILTMEFATSAPACDVEKKMKIFEMLGQAHMIPILHEFESNPGPHRFSELHEKLGVPQTTLTDRLQELNEDGFIERESLDEIPPRVEYTATEKTTSLAPAFEYLSRWGVYHDI
jgi:DNA-binding HxlR family transcriptional regulator